MIVNNLPLSYLWQILNLVAGHLLISNNSNRGICLDRLTQFQFQVDEIPRV